MLTREQAIRHLKAVRYSSAADRIAGRSLTMADIARATGVAREYLSDIASEKQRLGPKTLAKLSDFFERKDERCSRASVPSSSVETPSGTSISVVFGQDRRN